MNYLKAALVSIVLLLLSCMMATTHSDEDPGQVINPLDSVLTPLLTIENAYANQLSDISVLVKGMVITVLSDYTVGDQHQRFIIRLSNNQTLLIAHNIDIGKRVVGIAVGSVVYVHGDYVWNDEGGVIHWTHKDPDGIHEDGWIEFNNCKYD